MSLKPVHIVQAPFFYPAGNTPAVCLSQSLPPEQDAALLLLGCGDVRNILFTVYSGGGAGRYRLITFAFLSHIGGTWVHELTMVLPMFKLAWLSIGLEYLAVDFCFSF
jgi:hypothetical protein